MLFYFASGERDYGNQPVAVGRSRLGWEFQAVTSGKIARTSGAGNEVAPYESSLWLSSPDSTHGWTAQPGKPSTVVVFHFRYVPQALIHLMGKRDSLRIDLSETQIQRIGHLAREAESFWHRPSPGMNLCFDAILSELSYLVYQATADEKTHARESSIRNVDRALLYFEENLRTNPSIAMIAGKIGTSTAHLRRGFHEVLEMSPKAAFEQIRDRQVVQMLTDSESSLAQIAEETGFSESSALSRAFKQRHGFPPSHLRRRAT